MHDCLFTECAPAERSTAEELERVSTQLVEAMGQYRYH